MSAVLVNLFPKPPAAAIPGLATGGGSTGATTNGAGPGGGVPLPPGGVPAPVPVPTGTPVVSVLPGPTDPLSTIGQYVIFGGVPYVFAPDPGGGPGGFWKIATVSSTTISDTHANRSTYPAASYPVGTLYFETDTLVSYAVQNPGGVNEWMYYNGVRVDVLANIPTLGILDVNYTFQASDYKHSWVWNGTAWNFAPGSSSGYYVFVASVGFLPDGLWGVCDGSTYDVAQNDATTIPVTTPIFAGQYLRR